MLFRSISPSPALDLAGNEGGRPLSPETREHAERGLGIDASRVRLHEGREAELAASSLGAKAFTAGQHIWLGAGASESDPSLMAHELAHVRQQPGALALRSATWLERRAWLSFFSHYMPRKLLNNYMDDTGNPITLTQQEMMDVNPRVDISASAAFRTELGALQGQVASNAAAGIQVPAVKFIEVSGPGQAMTNGTLGNFTIKYKGTLQVNTDGTWIFFGVMSFYDYWDFDPKPFGTSGRSNAGEVKTRVGANFIPGQPFHIYSEETVVTQSGSDPRANWAGGKPKFVNDRAGTSGLDIGAGDVGGGDVGAEVGAQGSEDINR